MPEKYFFGTSLFGPKPVKASSAKTFREVLYDHILVCPPLNITKAAFLALPKEQRDEVKRVPYLVAACFQESPSAREYASAVCCNLIFIDLDEEKDGRCPAAPFYHNPDSLYTALAGFNFIAHITATSTDVKPRMRIIIDAISIPLDKYTAACATIGALLGIPHLNKESKVAVQPMFLPAFFSDTTEEDHPLIAYELDAKPFTVRDIVTAQQPSTPEARTDGSMDPLDSLAFLRAPVPEITLATAREALFTIDPDCSYFDWLEVAAALRHQFPNTAEEAYELFDEWSSKGSKYANTKDTRDKWKSLRPSPKDRVPVTIRSLLRQAVASGWDDKKVKTSVFQNIMRWFREVAEVSTLMSEGVRRILGTPLLSAMEEDVVIHEFCLQAKKRFHYNVNATSVRKEIAKTKKEMQAKEKPAEKAKMPTWCNGVLYVACTQHFFRQRTGEKYKKEAWNDAYARWLLPTEETLRSSGQEIDPAMLARPTVLPSDYALNHLRIPTVYDYAYSPDKPTELFFVHNQKKYVNTYTPSYPELDEETAEEAGGILQRHLELLIAEPEYQRLVTDYMAYMVQYPGRKIRWAILIQSEEGAGKTFLANAMKAVLGPQHVQIINGPTIKGGWNEWSAGKQLIVMEEIKVSGASRAEIMNSLKELITNDTIPINERLRNTREVENITNYIIFSNFHDALALTSGDRRYCVLKSPLQDKASIKALGESYFLNLFQMLKTKAGGLRKYLMDWDISADFSPNGHAPRTKYAEEMISDTASDVVSAVRRLLLEGDMALIQYDVVSSKSLIDAVYCEGLRKVTNQQLAAVLREEGMHNCGRYTIAGERHYIWARKRITPEKAIAVAMERHLKDTKNLCMELIYQ